MGKKENYAEIKMEKFIPIKDYDEKIGKGIIKLLGTPIISRGFPGGQNHLLCMKHIIKKGQLFA